MQPDKVHVLAQGLRRLRAAGPARAVRAGAAHGVALRAGPVALPAGQGHGPAVHLPELPAAGRAGAAEVGGGEEGEGGGDRPVGEGEV